MRVGEYRLLTKIGEGGMGVVHLALAPDGRRVALKVLRPHIVGDDEARERLAREVASLRLVKSPRIAEVLDADPWGETPFVATRYVPGFSLHQHIGEEGQIRGDDLRWFATGLMEAVIAVHGVGVLHRDIKPSNVLLEGRSPVLIDFGLARLAEDPRITHTGWLLGTPGYLAPEILYGDDATTASDVHSWAATVVFAAAGEPPFGTGPAMAIMDRVRRGEHRLSAVPADLLPLIERCLSPDPADRPTSDEALVSLGSTRPSRVQDDFTMPFAVAGFVDDDPTDVLGTDARTGVVGDPATVPQTWARPPSTRSLPAAISQGQSVAQPARSVAQPARSPYMQPPPPMDPRHQQGESWRPSPSGPAKLRRGCLLLGIGALVTVGFAWAPYVSLLLIAVAALGIRTVSWTTEAARDRKCLRGRDRWYDGPLTALTMPWYLVVAAGGTLLLLLWSVALAFIVGLAYLLFRLPLVPGLLLMGAVLAVSLWWGPGSRRLRTPTRLVLARSTRRAWLGWVSFGVLGLVIASCAYGLLSSGVDWNPQPGPPWRAGTLLGGIVGYL